MTANEDLITLQNKVADLTEALALTQRTVTKISTILTNTTAISSAVTLVNQSITPYHPNSVGSILAAAATAAPASAAYPVANRAVYVPFYVPASTTVYKAFWMNGTVVSGNIDVGIYSSAGTRLASIGSTAQTGTSTHQIATLSYTLAAGNYYMAFAMDNTTGAVFLHGMTSAPYPADAFNIRLQTSAFALPATATFGAVATPVSNYLPFFGLSFRSDFA